MEIWPKVKLGKVEVGSNIAQNHSSMPKEVIICPNSHESWTECEIRSKFGWTLLRIAPLAKSYLVIICPNAYAKLIKSEIMLSWSRFEHCSKSLV